MDLFIFIHYCVVAQSLKTTGQTQLFNFGIATSLGKGKTLNSK